MASIWINETNPYHLPEPPAWWQNIVYDYDKMLRLLPSQKDRVYRLGRLVRREARLGLSAMQEVHKHPDTVMMIRHGLVPISTVLPWAIHSSKILRDLRARDLWREFGDERGLDRYLAQLDETEAQAKAREQAALDAEMDQRNADAFKYVQALKGERVGMLDIERGRRGATADTDHTRVKVAMPGQTRVPSTRQAAPGGPAEKISGVTRGVVLTDSR
jgi:hypothetical protein